MDCPDPPRNVKYSRDFYRAQKRLLEKTSKSGTDLGLEVAGIALGYADSSSYDLTDYEELTESDAVRIVTQEISDKGAQLFGEGSALICRLSHMPISSYEKALAFEALSQLGSLAMGRASGWLPSVERPFFSIAPRRRAIVFADDETERSVIVYVQNHLPSELEVQPSEAGLQADILGLLPVIYAGDPGPITLKAMERRPLVYKVKRPIGATEPITETVQLEATADQTVAVDLIFDLYPTRDTLLAWPTLEPGELQPLAGIYVTAPGHPAFEPEVQSQWLTLDIERRGPNMGYAEATSGHALYTATNAIIARRDFISGDIRIEMEVGGMSGPDGTNTGGSGWIDPYYRTELELPELSKSRRWDVDARLMFSGGGVSGHESPIVRPCTLTISPPMGQPVQASAGFNEGPTSVRLQDVAGRVEIFLDGAYVTRGSLGAKQGHVGAGSASIRLSVKAAQTER